MSEVFSQLAGELTLSSETLQISRLHEVQRAHDEKLRSTGIASEAYGQLPAEAQADIDSRDAWQVQAIVARLPRHNTAEGTGSFTSYAVCFRLPNVSESGNIEPTTLYAHHIGDRDRIVVMPNYGFNENDVVTVSHMVDELQTMHDNGIFELDDSLTQLYLDGEDSGFDS